MRALTWHGKHDVRVENVPDPQIVNPRDAIIKITSSAICGSDLHLYDSMIPTMHRGDILGHEFMGEIVELGSEAAKTLKVGDRVLTPFNIACGSCFFCETELYSCCDNSCPAEKQDLAEAAFGKPMAGLFGYSHMTGGYAGGQAQYVRVPYADVGCFKVPDGMPDEKVLFLTDIFPTGWMAALNCEIQPGDTVAIWGCGPVGQFAIRSAFLQGAERVIAIDHIPARLEMARAAGAETLDYHEVKVRDALDDMTAGRGPDACIDAVGMEAHGFAPDNIVDAIKQETKLATDRPHVFREILLAVRKGGHVSVPGVYGGVADKVPIGALMQKGVTIKTGQTHCHKFIPQLMEMVQEDRIDPSFIISHQLSLEDAPDGYRMFHSHQNECTKVVLKPH